MGMDLTCYPTNHFPEVASLGADSCQFWQRNRAKGNSYWMIKLLTWLCNALHLCLHVNVYEYITYTHIPTI